MREGGPSLPKLNPAARKLVLEDIEAQREMGDRLLAAAIEMLLVLHDKIHGGKP